MQKDVKIVLPADYAPSPALRKPRAMRISYGVRQAEIRIALGLPESGFEERSLKDWLEITNQDPVLGRRKVEALILQAHSAKTKRPSP